MRSAGISPRHSRWVGGWVRVQCQDRSIGGSRYVCLAYPSLATVALKLLTNTSQVSSHTIVVGMVLGRRRVWKLCFSTLDRLIDSLGSGLPALFARDVGMALLGLVREEKLDSLSATVCVWAVICCEHDLLGGSQGITEHTSSFLDLWRQKGRPRLVLARGWGSSCLGLFGKGGRNPTW